MREGWKERERERRKLLISASSQLVYIENENGIG